MKINFKFLTFVIAAILITTTVIVSANGSIVKEDSAQKNMTRYEKLALKNEDFKERAQKAGIADAQQVEMKFPANKGISSKVKPLNNMKGYIKDEDLKDGAKYLKKELLTYGQLINSSNVDLDPAISEDRMLWVTETHYPNGFNHRKGFVKNAILTKYYDAETGELLGYGLKSLEKGGNGITMEKSKDGLKNTDYVKPEDKKTP